MKTQAAVLVELDQPLEIVELEIPPLKRGQVLVKLFYSGVCRSQINEIKGFKGHDPYLPHTLGHEGSGIVVEVGEGVSKVQTGDAVVLTWIKGKGLEQPGTLYKWGSRSVNSGAISTFMEYAIISENRLVPIPSSIPLREAALFGCAIPTGAGIVFNDLNMPRGSSLAVFGLGGIGLSAILAARFKEARQIIAIDRGKAKLHLALELGATQCIDVQTQDPLMAIAEMTQGLGVDFAIEAVGQKVAMETAFKAVKDKGGVCILAGNVPKGTCLECDPFDFIKGKKMMGTWGGGVDPDRDIPLFLENFRDVQAMISQEAPLHEINQVIELLEKGSVARAFIKFNGSRTD